MVKTLASLRPAIRVDNQRKAELLRQLNDCKLITPRDQEK